MHVSGCCGNFQGCWCMKPCFNSDLHMSRKDLLLPSKFQEYVGFYRGVSSHSSKFWVEFHVPDPCAQVSMGNYADSPRSFLGLLLESKWVRHVLSWNFFPKPGNQIHQQEQITKGRIQTWEAKTSCFESSILTTILEVSLAKEPHWILGMVSKARKIFKYKQIRCET